MALLWNIALDIDCSIMEHAGMDVQTYLRKRSISVTAAALESGLNRSVLQRIVNGSRPASRYAIEKIVKWSGGAVAYADFFEQAAGEGQAPAEKDAAA